MPFNTIQGSIHLQAMQFFAYHGCTIEEQKIGCKYIVDVTIRTDVTKAALEDDLTGTIDYSKVYACIAVEMLKSVKLLEALAKRIIDVLFLQFEQAQSIKLCIAKCNPPIGGVCKHAKICLEINR